MVLAAALKAELKKRGHEVVAVDDVALGVSDLLLLKNQSASSENGIYTFNGASSAMTRATDCDTWDKLLGGFVYVGAGTTNGKTTWSCTVVAGGTLGTTEIIWRLAPKATALAIPAQ